MGSHLGKNSVLPQLSPICRKLRTHSNSVRVSGVCLNDKSSVSTVLKRWTAAIQYPSESHLRLSNRFSTAGASVGGGRSRSQVMPMRHRLGSLHS